MLVDNVAVRKLLMDRVSDFGCVWLFTLEWFVFWICVGFSESCGFVVGASILPSSWKSILDCSVVC